jgi:MYXO-CTERM domain-containing protein
LAQFGGLVPVAQASPGGAAPFSDAVSTPDWKVPRNGVVIGSRYCPDCQFEQLEIRDPDQVLVDGHFVEATLGELSPWIYIPERNFSPGIYTVSFLGSAYSESFEVLDVDAEFPKIVTELEGASSADLSLCRMGDEVVGIELEARVPPPEGRLTVRVSGRFKDQYSYRLLINEEEQRAQEGEFLLSPMPEDVCYELYAESMSGAGGPTLIDGKCWTSLSTNPCSDEPGCCPLDKDRDQVVENDASSDPESHSLSVAPGCGCRLEGTGRTPNNGFGLGGLSLVFLLGRLRRREITRPALSLGSKT